MGGAVREILKDFKIVFYAPRVNKKDNTNSGYLSCIFFRDSCFGYIWN